MFLKYFSAVILTGLLFPVSSYAHKLKCEIYDLAFGGNLVESSVIELKDSDLRKEVPFKVILNHELMSAEFSLSFLDNEDEMLLFQIQTQEVRNAEYAKFLVPLSKLNAGKSHQLGRVFTEITGIGDNTMSFCSLTVENNQ